MMDLRIISIGALDMHPLWGERHPVRTSHATTSLIRVKDASILVDPGLPAPVLQARLSERAGITPADITHVFLTSFRPDVRRGLDAFPEAVWYVSETERETIGTQLVNQLHIAREGGEAELVEALSRDVALLHRSEAAPDSLARGVDLFPLPGVSPGMTGLLLADPKHTTLICGDAIPTIEHLESGQVPKWAADGAKAAESFSEAIEIADLLVLGRDNLVVNPMRRLF